jgi:hypothetical protein
MFENVFHCQQSSVTDLWVSCNTHRGVLAFLQLMLTEHFKLPVLGDIK